MAKKLSKFGAAFKAARDKGEGVFDFGGKKYNTKMKGEGKKKSKLPSTTNVKPTPRPDATASGKRNGAFNPTQQQGRKSGADHVFSNSGPSFRGGGPKIAKSKQNMEKNAPKKSRETRKSEAYIKN